MTDNLVKRLREGACLHNQLEAYVLTTKAADRIEELETGLELAVQMRVMQKAYFKERTPDLLINAKMCEAAFDRVMLENKND
jgi:hypothetical protein